jgi:hypothetical protein
MSFSILGFGFHGGGSGGGGTPGPAGTPGSVWRNGSGIPSNSLGINGDYYLNNDNGFVFQKVAGAYVQVASIKGADGEAGADGANSTRYNYDDGGATPPPSNAFTANNDDLDLLTEIYVNNLNQDGLNFYSWWEFLLNWYSIKSAQNNFVQIREVDTTLVIGTYLVDTITDNTTYFTLSLIAYGEAQGTLDPTKTYVLSYAIGGADGSQGEQGVNAANSNIYFIDNVTSPPPTERFNVSPNGLASLITRIDIAVDNIYGDQTSWLNGAKLLSDDGKLGYLSVSPTTQPNGQAIFVIDGVDDNTTYYSFSVTFYGGNDLDFAAFNYPKIFVFSYVFNGSAGNSFVPYTGAIQNVDLGTNNLSANALFIGFTSVAASATPIVLTIASTPEYVITGSGGQVMQLPNATTLPNGATFSFNNNQSSGAITVNNNSGTLIVSIPSGAYTRIVLISNSNAAGTWDLHDLAPSNVSWSTNTFNVPASITGATWNGNIIALNRGGTNANLTASNGGVIYSTATALAITAVGSSNQVLISNGAAAPSWANASAIPTRFEIVVAASDETTALTTGTAKITFRMPRAVTLTSVRASLTTAQVSGSIFTVDINQNGTSILSTKLTVDNGEKTSTTAATPPVISVTSLADDAEITIDIDQVGNGTATGLKVSLIGTYA